MPLSSRLESSSLPVRLAWMVLSNSAAAACVAAAMGIVAFAHLNQAQSLENWRSEVSRFSAVIAISVHNFELYHADDLTKVFVQSQPLTLGAEVHHVGGMLVSKQGETQHPPSASVVVERLPLTLQRSEETEGYITLYRKDLSLWQATKGYVPVVSMGILGICFFVAWLIYRRIHRELGQPLQTLSDRVASYSLHERTVDPLNTGAKEVINLSNVFQSMGDRIRQLAITDPVTELPNRLYLEWLMQQAEHRPDVHCAMLLWDIDHFKSINDNFGHDIGDNLLLEVANRMHKTIPREVELVRMGGDEFVVWLDGLDSEGLAREVGEKILKAFEAPVVLTNGAELLLRLSGGMALYPRDAHSPTNLLKAADLALYQTKAKRTADITCFAPYMREEAREWLEIAEVLRKLHENTEHIFFFQPIVYVQSGRVWGYEMLLRLKNASGLYFDPEKVLQVASQTNTLMVFTQITFEQGVEFLKKASSTTALTINLAPSQLILMGSRFVERVLLEVPLSLRKRLTIEITEQTLHDRADLLLVVLRIKKLGYQFALDDFGSGYSSLNCLTSLPIYLVKLDKSFIKQAEKGKREQLLFQSIIRVTADLGLLTLVEGVENRHQMALVKRLGCDFAQGYLLGKPVNENINTPRELGLNCMVEDGGG